MARRFTSLLVLLVLATAGAWAQDLSGNATADDWEEINFDFDSSVLVDGFPSLLRLAELLQANPEYSVRVEGHTDILGSDEYNTALGLRRANAVRDFLLKYGAGAGQVTAATRGENDPTDGPQGTTFARTDEARYVNRRVTLTVTDAQGNTVGAGGAGEAIQALDQATQEALQNIQECCDQILARLDRLDEIAALLRDLADQNAELRRQVDDLRQNQQAIESRLNEPVPEPPTPPSADEVATAVRDQLAEEKKPTFQLLGANVGSDAEGNIAASGRGRFFGPLGDNFGVQAQAEYYYIQGKQAEGQFDIGMVDRFADRFQAGLFASFKNVSLSGYQTSGTVGQASLVMDYLFNRGRVGMFATKGFMDNALINRTNYVSPTGLLSSNVLLESYLKIVDQIGLSATVGLAGNVYAEGNVGYLRSTASGNRGGGSLRFVFPMNDKVAFTLEGGVNETMLPGNYNQGRVVAGVQFGNFLRPKQYLGADHAIPMEVPRVRYEVVSRRVRLGNDAPVADAGPDLSGVDAGTVALDGSNSYDPDGDPLTYQWVQETGAPVQIANATAAQTSFVAQLGQNYIFRLIVKDDQGGQGVDRVRISTRQADEVDIVFFRSDPSQIGAGEASTLSWRVEHADTVMIEGIGNVEPTGSTTVSPTSTTTYKLIARNNVGEKSATTTVVVTGATFQYCFATPSNIIRGESATLNWSAQNADSVTIQPGGQTVGATGNFVVSPLESTTYTLTATGSGATDSCSIAVTVGRGEVPRIIRFSAQPNRIDSGDFSTLFWVVENADTVNITTLGDVQPAGTQDVSPAETTTYILTATNASGSSTAQAVVNVNVIPPPQILSFTANPMTIPAPGERSQLVCETQGASSVNIGPARFETAVASLPVFPTEDTTYTCTARNSKGESVSETVTVRIVPPEPPDNTDDNPVIVFAGGDHIDTILRLIQLDASASFSPVGNEPLTYLWTVRNNQAAILNPTSPTPDVQLGIIAGDYVFDLTVTDSMGNQTTRTLIVTFKSQAVP